MGGTSAEAGVNVEAETPKTTSPTVLTVTSAEAGVNIEAETPCEFSYIDYTYPFFGQIKRMKGDLCHSGKCDVVSALFS